jgi:hypothetical protein
LPDRRQATTVAVRGRFRPRLSSVEIPIACTLEPADARAQGDEWRELLARLIVRVERVAADNLKLWLKDDVDELPRLVALAQREKACCPFFNFSLEVEAGAVAFVVEVPPDAASLLDGFATFAHRT